MKKRKERYSKEKQTGPSKKRTFRKVSKKNFPAAEKTTEGIRLNKYLANAGVASRRAADQLIESGAVKINGKVVTRLGTKVLPGDKVEFGGETLREEKHRYLLLNKPKGYLTTSDDPFNRRTVMHLVEKACPERIYPVGRLDRNTMGLLLFTNDGELAKKLMHPKHNVKKIYHVYLDKNLTKNDMLRIAEGLELEDGKIIPDSIAYVAGADDKKQIGIELHSGKNRIVRRIFEHLGYQVIKLDRVFLAGLTKKDLPRGKWRFLTQKEINMLKRLG
ncbi:pseudouridine synthase [Candidatus Sulfidibacterium hydrothermale]|uniref:pseudouridine synthase n=1 Tax=Candidatus Sulfidibacterium hydrothermale TaxID=2875962 RepID=UPI0021D42884|nr:pseudouridine synthase [Candidatus Sulfidibacterium hydrothermale]